MSLHAYLRPDVKPTDKHPQGCRYFILQTNQAKVALYEEGGTYYTKLDDTAPIHPELRPLIASYSYRGEHLIFSLKNQILPGHYVHGKFRAIAKVEIRNGNSVVVVTATAPTRSLLNRWLRVLENGEDRPTTAKPPKGNIVDLINTEIRNRAA